MAGMLALALAVGPARAVRADDDTNGLTGAISDIFNGAMAIPAGIIAGTFSGPPILGTVGGALSGAMNTLSYALRDVLRLVGVAIPMAAKAASYLPLFL